MGRIAQHPTATDAAPPNPQRIRRNSHAIALAVVAAPVGFNGAFMAKQDAQAKNGADNAPGDSGGNSGGADDGACYK